MANAWFRMYSEFLNDPKVQMMSEAYQRRFIMILCSRCSNGDVTLQDEEVAFQLRISNEEWVATKAVFISKNLITEDNNPTAWEKRQFASDSSAERVARHREKKKAECNVTVTPQNRTEQNRTDTEEPSKALPPAKPARAARFDVAKHLIERGVSETVAADWITLRRSKKAAATETAIAGIEAEAAKAGMSIADALATCCSRGWAGFKAEWLERDRPASAKTGAPNLSDRREATISALTGRAPAQTAQPPLTANLPAIEGASHRVA